jgi:serine/threonine-protein kinase
MSETSAGRYLILGPLGAGGMGVVYRAHDPSLERDVALKFLTDEAATDETARLRLLREARTAATLNHPNISTIHEVGEADGRLYIAMELVDGESVQRRIAFRGLLPATVIDYGVQIADALDHAHARGVVHRDLKSANVMVTPEGRVKVLDFGIARRVESPLAGDDALDASAGPTLTAEGMVLGTPHYLPPEVVRGQPADARSDIWALGVLLYEMVSGRLPFPGGSITDLALAIVNREPAPLPDTVPAGLRSVILHCLAKDPGRRYQHASEVRAALEAVRDSGTTAVTVAMPARRGGAAAARWRAGALVAVAIGVFFALRAGGLLGGSSGAETLRSLAVLPLANLSGDPKQDYFADGMTEELITRLASIESLKVISRTSVMKYRGTTKPIPEIAKELGVDGVVEGSVIRAGDRVKITAQLIDAAHDRHLWAESYERGVMDVLAMQTEVAQDIAAKVRLNLSAAQRERMAGQRIRNPAAYEQYLRGRAAWNQVSGASVHTAISFFERAIVLDSTDARSYAGLADAYLLLSQVIGEMQFSEAFPKVREYARRALELDPNLAEANVSMAIAQMWVEHDWPGAERSLERALSLNPGYAPAYIVKGTLYGVLGRISEAVAIARRAVELDPNSSVARFALAWQLVMQRRYDQAVAEIMTIKKMDPTHLASNSVLARIYEIRGEYPKAIEISRVDPGWYGVPPPTDALRRGFEAQGPRGYWQAYAAATIHRPKERKSYAWMAYADLQLGNTDEAIHWLRTAYELGEGDLIFMRHSPLFEKLHGDPRFDSLLVENGLRPIGPAGRSAP